MSSPDTQRSSVQIYIISFSHRNRILAKNQEKYHTKDYGNKKSRSHWYVSKSGAFHNIFMMISRAGPCDEIDACLQTLIGSSSAVFVEGLCTYFISNPDNADSSHAMRAAIDALEDLCQRAHSLVESVIEECGTVHDLSRTQDSVFRVQRVLTAVKDVFAHAMLGVDYFVEVHGQCKLKHQITLLDNTAVVP